jgi:NADH-quinone oxidoreductase subunit M
MVLAGKLGLYSILRFSLGIFPEQSHRIAPLMISLGAIGIVYGALLALVQKDLKKLAAFGTLGHVSVVVLGIFTFTIAGLDGGIYQTLNEGLGGGALFMLLGLLYERYGTYDMREYGGLAAKLPWVVTMFVITTLSVIGLPMLNGFVGEFLVFSGSMQSTILHHTGWTVLATSGVILTAAYMLTMIQKVFYGDLGLKSRAIPGRDLDAREHLALWPMVALFLLMGVVSPYWMRAIDQTGERLSAEPTAQSTLEQESMPISTAAPKPLREQARHSLTASVMTSSPSQGGQR